MIRTYLSRATWAEIYLINWIGGAAIVLVGWVGICVAAAYL